MITVIKSSFVQHKLTLLRNKKTSNTVFRQTMNETSYLIAAEVLKYLPYKRVKIQTSWATSTNWKLEYNWKLKPMNILLIGPLPPLRGGISDFNYELLKDLVKTQNVQALSFQYLYPKFLFPGKSQLSKKVPIDFKIKKINPYNPLDYINALNHIRKI